MDQPAGDDVVLPASAPGDTAMADVVETITTNAPTTDSTDGNGTISAEKPAVDGDAAPQSAAGGQQYSASTESILKRINEDAAIAAATGTPGWEAARASVMRDMQTVDKIPTPPPPRDTSTTKRGRGGKRASFADGESIVKTEGNGSQTTPGSTGRGRGGGRPRGRGRGGGRGGKRKREGQEDDETDDSEVYSPLVTQTKSGRNISKPTSFVPPPPSPTTTNKRKRPYRRNLEAALCKVCLRGTSPASNMIVFCDGCNTPYHRMCHKPPIDQAVIDEVDKEWYCSQCERQRVAPVPDSHVSDFVSAPGASVEQVRSLPNMKRVAADC
jgi:hypothetical protein